MGNSGLGPQQLTTPRFLRQYATEGAGLSPHITQIGRTRRDVRPNGNERAKANPQIAQVPQIRLDAALGSLEGAMHSAQPVRPGGSIDDFAGGAKRTTEATICLKIHILVASIGAKTAFFGRIRADFRAILSPLPLFACDSVSSRGASVDLPPLILRAGISLCRISSSGGEQTNFPKLSSV